MDWNGLFGLVGLPAMLGWAILIFAPRGIRWLDMLPRLVIPLGLAVVYSGLALGFMYQSGGGFGSIAAVRTLFASDPVLLAGWVHYLAFDLLIGGFVAARLDAAGVARLVQAPVLVAIFMLGPLGLLMGLLTEAGARGRFPVPHTGVGE